MFKDGGLGDGVPTSGGRVWPQPGIALGPRPLWTSALSAEPRAIKPVPRRRLSRCCGLELRCAQGLTVASGVSAAPLGPRFTVHMGQSRCRGSLGPKPQAPDPQAPDPDPRLQTLMAHQR